jgi:hypothetical protein
MASAFAGYPLGRLGTSQVLLIVFRGRRRKLPLKPRTLLMPQSLEKRDNDRWRCPAYPHFQKIWKKKENLEIQPCAGPTLFNFIRYYMNAFSACQGVHLKKIAQTALPGMPSAPDPQQSIHFFNIFSVSAHPLWLRERGAGFIPCLPSAPAFRPVQAQCWRREHTAVIFQ